MRQKFKFSARTGFFLLLVFISLKGFSQTVITGKITGGTTQEPVPGATIEIRGTKTAMQTSMDGTFKMSVPNTNAVLVVTAVGYEKQQITVGNRTMVELNLQQSSAALNEVVVTGYTAQRKKDLTGAVSVVNVEQLTKQPVANIENQLQGQAAGVTVVGSGQPGEAPQVRIRGFNTFGNNAPLYVVDGIPTQNVSDINPNDIASMQVLKDAGSASIYGSRASNGVIIITTRRGSGKVKVQYDSYYGTQTPPSGNVWNLLNPEEMMTLTRLAQVNGGNATPKNAQYGSGTYTLPDYILGGSSGGLPASSPLVNPALYKVNPFYNTGTIPTDIYQITQANKAGTDWFHEIFKNAPITSHNVAVSGGGDQGSYLFSLNYFNQQGTLIETYQKRYSLRSNSVFNVNKNIRIGENIEFSITDNPRIGALAEGSAIGMSFREQPIIPVYDIMGNFAGTRAPDLGNARNPVAIQKRTADNRGMANRVFGNVFAEVDFLQHFNFRTNFGGESFSSSSHTFTYPEYENVENNTINTYTDTANNRYNFSWTNTLSYNQSFNKHTLRVLIGSESNQNMGRNMYASRSSYFIFDPNFTNLSTGTGDRNTVSGQFNEKLFSLFARVDYNFDSKYLIGATVRRDGSSKFGANNQYGTFPAVSAAWRISQENFLKDVAWISDLKIRGSWGIMGSQFNVNPNNAFYTYGLSQNNSSYPIAGGNSLAAGLYQTHIGNPDAKWESDVNSNIGIDASLFGGKLEFSGDYYQKDIRDLLYAPELPATSGQATPPTVNIASMKNKGFDLSLTGRINITRDLILNATATLTTYDNKIKSISGGTPYYDIPEARRFVGSTIVRNQVGMGVGQFFGYKVDGFWDDDAEIAAANSKAPSGVFQNDVKVGRFRYADVNGDGQITAADRTFIGNPNPKFTYGFNLGLTYKDFDFSMFFYGVQGSELWNNVKYWTDFFGGFTGAKSKTALYDSWTPTNHNAKAPIQETNGSFSSNSVPNSYFVENGSYLRARNTQLGYNLPASTFSRIGVQRLRVYVSAANLFTITKYSGADPEIPASSTGTYRGDTFGVDEGPYPSSKTFLVGLGITF